MFDSQVITLNTLSLYRTISPCTKQYKNTNQVYLIKVEEKNFDANICQSTIVDNTFEAKRDYKVIKEKDPKHIKTLTTMLLHAFRCADVLEKSDKNSVHV